MSDYLPGEYWSRLHGESHDESVVGYPELPVSLNRAIFAALVASTSRMLADHGLLRRPGRVLDVGSGTGIWLEFWQRAGADEIVGCDLAEGAVEHLRSIYPRLRIERADIGALEPPFDDQFDVVSAIAVLLHIVDEQRWRQAVSNIARLVRPGGHVVLVEPIIVHRWWGPPAQDGSNSSVRTRAAWVAAARDGGLELIDLRPATVLLSNVIDTRTRRGFAAMWTYWGLLQRLTHGREWAGRALGAALGALDGPLRRALPHGPSSKLLLLRRTEALVTATTTPSLESDA